MPVVAATLRWCTDAELRALEAVPDDHAALVLVVAVARARAEVPNAQPEDAPEAEAGDTQRPAEERNRPSAGADAEARVAGQGGEGLSADEVLGLTRDRADDLPADLTAAVAAASAALRGALGAIPAAGRDRPGDPVRAQIRGAVTRAEAALHALRRGHAGLPLPDELRDRVRVVVGAAGVEPARADAWAADWWVSQDEALADAAPADLWPDERGRAAVRALLELTLHQPLGAWG